MADLIDWKTALKANPGALDGKWASFDSFTGQHMEGIVFTDNRKNLLLQTAADAPSDGTDDKRQPGLNTKPHGIPFMQHLGGTFVPDPTVFTASIRVIEPFSMPRILLLDGTNLTGDFKPHGDNAYDVILLDGRKLLVPLTAVKYVVQTVLDEGNPFA